MKRSICLAIVLTMFALPVTAHDTEMLKGDISFWLKGAPNPECVSKNINLNKMSKKDLEQLHRVLSSPMMAKASIDKVDAIINKCKKEKGRQEQQASREKIEKLIPNLLKTNNGVMKTCMDSDPKYLSIKGDKISGKVYDRLNKYSKRTGLKIKYTITSSFSKCLVGMEDGIYDIVTLVTKKPERDKLMDYYKKGSKGIYISKKSPFAKFPDELRNSVDVGL